MSLGATAILLLLAQEYRSYSRFPAPERWVETGVSDTGVRHAVQTGSIKQSTAEEAGFTYRSAWLRGDFPEDHKTKISYSSYYQVYRCDKRTLARTYTMTTYRGRIDSEIKSYDAKDWVWEKYEWLPAHEQAAFDIVCNERM